MLQAKLGVSAMYGPRNDQFERTAQQQRVRRRRAHRGRGLYVNAEYVRVDEGQGTTEDDVAGRVAVFVRVRARGGYVQLAYALTLDLGPLRKADPLRALRPAPRLVRRLHADHGRSIHGRSAHRSVGAVILKGEYLGTASSSARRPWQTT